MAAVIAESKIANPEIKASIIKSLRADQLKTDGTISSSPASVSSHLPHGTSEVFVSPATVKSLVHDSGPFDDLVNILVTNPIVKAVEQTVFITSATAGAALLAAKAVDRNLKIDNHNTRLSRRGAIFAAGAGFLTLAGTTAACVVAPLIGVKIPGVTEVPSTQDMTLRKRKPGDTDLTEQDTAFMATFASAFRNDNFSQGAQVATLADETQDTELVVIKSIDGKQTTVLNKVHAFRGDQELFFVQFLDANGTVQTTQVQDILQKQDENGNFVVSVRVKNAQNGTAIIEQQTWKKHWDLETADSNVLMSTVVFDPIRQLFYSSKTDAAILINSLVSSTTATATKTPDAVPSSTPTAAPTATPTVEFSPTPDPVKAETIKSQKTLLDLAQAQGLKDVQVASFWNQKNGTEMKVNSILVSSTDKTRAWILGLKKDRLVEIPQVPDLVLNPNFSQEGNFNIDYLNAAGVNITRFDVNDKIHNSQLIWNWEKMNENEKDLALRFIFSHINSNNTFNQQQVEWIIKAMTTWMPKVTDFSLPPDIASYWEWTVEELSPNYLYEALSRLRYVSHAPGPNLADELSGGMILSDSVILFTDPSWQSLSESTRLALTAYPIVKEATAVHYAEDRGIKDLCRTPAITRTAEIFGQIWSYIVIKNVDSYINDSSSRNYWRNTLIPWKINLIKNTPPCAK